MNDAQKAWGQVRAQGRRLKASARTQVRKIETLSELAAELQDLTKTEGLSMIQHEDLNPEATASLLLSIAAAMRACDASERADRAMQEAWELAETVCTELDATARLLKGSRKRKQPKQGKKSK